MNAISVLDSGLLIFYTHTDHFKTSVVPWKPQPFRSCGMIKSKWKYDFYAEGKNSYAPTFCLVQLQLQLQS